MFVRKTRLLITVLALSLMLVPSALAQNNNTSGSSASRAASGQKMKLKGVVTRREVDSFTVRDLSGAETVVLLNDRTSVKTKGGFLRSGQNYGVTSILRGLNLEVEGRTDATGQLVADKIRFNSADYRVAQTVESRVNPVENRVSTAETRISDVEQNAQRISGQIDELAAVSNAARGGAVAAQESADAAVAGVNATNERISSLDDYQPQEMTAVNFRAGSAVLTQAEKVKLDQLAAKALNAKGYVIEVSGFADATGSTALNRRLSQQRADAVIRYLVENHNIPLRRIITPFGYGEAKPVADNTTRAGRAENRRVEVKILVNRGLTAPTPDMTPKSSTQTQGTL
ncbi:MAG TPA: OmpA family protein [Pyrinomonadaceae bacterium]|jgi:outer membrane protein OmpA-like peptidoglycan-associated protein